MSEPNDDAREKPRAAEAMQEAITARIIQDLKEGVPTWTRPWRKETGISGVSLPTNVVSGTGYSGINILQLMLTGMDQGYALPLWATFKQIQSIGARVKKGQKSTPVVYVNFVDHKDDRDKPEGKRRKVAFLKTYAVFNVAQMENVPVSYLKPPPMLPPSEYKLAAVRFAHDSGVSAIRFGCARAAYLPKIDQIEMPDLSLFAHEEAYVGVLMHELFHSSGHPDRLNRKYGQRFGDKQYAFEEICAELGSAFFCASLGVPPTTRGNAAYIQSWIEVLEQDYRAITTAASYASAGVAYMTAKVDETRSARLAAE